LIFSLSSPSLGRAVLSLLSSSRFFFFWWGATGGGNSERPEGKEEIQHNFFLNYYLAIFLFPVEGDLIFSNFCARNQKKKMKCLAIFLFSLF
jgi:hypothetical protein